MSRQQAIIEALEQLYENIGDETFAEVVESFLRIGNDNIDSEMRDQPAIYAYIGLMFARATDACDAIEAQIACSEADIHKSYVNEKLGASCKKPTAKDIEARINSDHTYITLQVKLKLAKYRLALFKRLSIALEHRKDMLVQLSSNRRNEIKLHH